MPNTLSFHQVDVFASKPLEGNALAVVSDADDLTAEQMAAFARWTNLSETTFLMRPTHPDADYRVRIFTPMRELPFAGHPTLGSCYVWLGDNGVRAFISNRSAEDPVTGSQCQPCPMANTSRANAEKIYRQPRYGVGASRTNSGGTHWRAHLDWWGSTKMHYRSSLFLTGADD
ncbi:putative PhzC/PhzF-like epimerase [Pseudomonas syringae pv. syringae str. B301D-R]|nr:phenazine biosynthesis protein PhzF family [Pseudomonas syringae pv. syringae B301D]EXL31323.1 putative PhzC/PhzF-like epimerase [Pseudomonas syringae pv. syringae str. B301D-R]SOP99756.1 putative epimerase [Pseudomonas syringae pv. syringae]